MAGQSKRSWRSWLPDWLKNWLHVRELHRAVRALDDHYRPLHDKVNVGDEKQAILAEWAFEAQWPESALAHVESARLRRLARRWLVDLPSYELDDQTGRWYIADEPRQKLRREIRKARREGIRWWIQTVVMPLIGLVGATTALIALLR